jgi:hypothetical protein
MLGGFPVFENFAHIVWDILAVAHMEEITWHRKGPARREQHGSHLQACRLKLAIGRQNSGISHSLSVLGYIGTARLSDEPSLI